MAERREPHGLEQLVAVHDDARRVGRRQHLLVVRELTVDEAADELGALHLEDHLVVLADQRRLFGDHRG